MWYLQEVEGIRKDVQVINLSLLNTGWYIGQLKKNMPEYIRYTEKQIDEYFDQHHMTSDGFMRRYWPEKKKIQLPATDSSEKIEWEFGPTMQVNVQGKSEGFIKIQDQMVLELIAYNAQMDWKRPIYFAVTVGNSNFVGLDEWMRMDGLCFRVVDYKADKGIDPKVVYERILGRYLPAYRNLSNPDIYFDDNIQRLLQNYRSAFLQLAIYFDETKINNDEMEDTQSLDLKINYDYIEFYKFSTNDKKRYILAKMEELIPSYIIPFSNEMVVAEIAGMYSDVGESDRGKELINGVDIKTLSLKKKIRFLLYTASRGYGEHSIGILDKILNEIELMPEKKEKYEKYFELYAGFVRVDEKMIVDKISEFILDKISSIRDQVLMNALFKEFGVIVYQGGNKDFAIKVIEKYLTINSKDLEAIDLLYQIYAISKDDKKALEAVERYLAIEPDNKEYLAIKADLE
ncbi:MAG: hypothetical protein L6407_02835 [Candidatus Delongbacteria bacterium]|nr:hypothetical protein [Candidatus Delongbacteria bacterium]